MLKVAYFGTPVFSADLLEKLIASKLMTISLVVTQPDKPVGRNQVLTPSPVKLIAQKYNIAIFDHDTLSELPGVIKQHQIDNALVFSYGKILKAETLSSPIIHFPETNFGFINIHPSLLPKYRGASPITFPLLLGDKETGVSIILMDELMDHGPIIAQEKLTIEKNDTPHTLTTKCTNLAFNLLSSLIQQLKIKNCLSGKICKILPGKLKIGEQFHARTTLTRPLTRDDGYISLDLLQKALHGESITPSELPAIYQWYYTKNNVTPPPIILDTKYIIRTLWRALSPWPGLWTTIMVNDQPKRLIIKQLTINKKQLTIVKIQLEGKKEVDFDTFNQAYPNIF